jgi:hypothetical protein
MAESAPTDEGFCYSIRGYSTHHTHIDSFLFDRFTDRESIDDRSEHTHVVAYSSIKPTLFERNPSKNISSSDDDGNFEFFFLCKKYNLFREKGKKTRINTISLISLECFSGKFEEDAFWCVVFFHEESIKENQKKKL